MNGSVDETAPFICPLSLNIMEDPVIDPEGNSYERSVIETWLRVSGTSPITRGPLTPAMLCPNKALKNAIENYKNRRGTQNPPNIQESDVVLDGTVLGRGSFGVVTKGYWRATAVAVKTLVPDAAETSPSLLAGLERELRLLSARCSDIIDPLQVNTRMQRVTWCLNMENLDVSQILCAGEVLDCQPTWP